MRQHVLLEGKAQYGTQCGGQSKCGNLQCCMRGECTYAMHSSSSRLHVCMECTMQTYDKRCVRGVLEMLS